MRRKIGFAALALVALIAGCLLALATPPGRALVAATVERAAAGAGLQVAITRPTGWLPFSFGAERIVVADAAGRFAEVEGLDLDIGTLALVAGQIVLDSATAERVAIMRRPQLPAGDGDGGTAVAAREIMISRLDLGETLAGRPASLSVNGDAALGGGGRLAATLSVERIDGRPGRLEASVSRPSSGAPLQASVELSEAADGILTGLLGRASGPAYELSAEITPSGNDMRGTLRLASSGTARLTGDFTIAGVDGLRRLTARARGNLGEFVPPDYSALLAGAVDLGIDADWAESGLTIRQGTVSTASLNGSLSGTLADNAADLRLAFSLADPAGGTIGLPMLPGGSAVRRADLSGTVRPANGVTRLELTGQVTDLRVGAIAAPGIGISVAAESAGNAPLSGRIPFALRLRASELTGAGTRIVATETEPVAITVDGTYDRDAGTAETTARLDAAGGSANFAGTVAADTARGELTAAWADIAALARIAGLAVGGGVRGRVAGTFIGDGGTELDLTASLADPVTANPGLTRLLAGDGELTAKISRSGTGPLRITDLAFQGPALSASGSAEIAGDLPYPAIEAQATIAEGRILNRRLTDTTLTLSGAPTATSWNGQLSLSGSFADAALSASSTATINTADGSLEVPELRLEHGSNVLNGRLARSGSGLFTGQLQLDAPDVQSLAALAGVEAAGSAAADIALMPAGDRQGAEIAFQATDIASGNARAGSASGRLSLDNLFGAPELDGEVAAREARIGSIALAAIDAAAEAANGITNYRVTARGDDLDLAGSGSFAEEEGAPVLRVETLRGRAYGRDIALDSPVAVRLGGGNGATTVARLTVGGGGLTVTTRSFAPLDIAVTAHGLPASLANGFVPNLGASGAINGSATVAGSTEAPEITWQVDWSDAILAAARRSGLPPLSLHAEGTATRTATSVDGRVSRNGLNLTFAGRVPFAGPGLSLKVNGNAPLQFLALQSDRELRLAGSADVAIDVTGTATAPVVSGTASLNNATIVDGETGFGIAGASGRIAFNGQQARLEGISGRLAQGGTVTVSGTVDVAGAGLPADLSITVANGRYSDGRAVNASFDANLAVTGPLLGTATVAGNLSLGRTELQLADLPTGSGAAIDVRHVNAGADFTPPLRPDASRSGNGGAGGGGLNLAIDVEAPRGILVRGFGVDAEFGGGLRLAGSISDPQAVGAFTLNWGRLEMLGRRFNLDSGTLTFSGDLVPFVQLTASTTTSDAVVAIHVTGQATDPTIAFSSSPDLPEEEILARLLFNRNAGSLSALQAVQLVDALGQLTGVAGGAGIFTRVRNALGVDDLDIRQSETGGTTVGIGTRINERVRLGVEAGSEAAAGRVTIDLNVTDNLKLRGEAGQDGAGKVGINFEREY